MVQLKQINITAWKDKKLLGFLEKIEGDVVLIGEENVYCVLVKEGVVVEEMSIRYSGPSIYKYSIKEWINDLKRGLEV